jgi:hypothetical protein
VLEENVGRNWAVGKSGIYYLMAPAADADTYSLMFFDPVSRRPSRPFPLPGTTRTLPVNVITVSPDERWIVYAQRDLLDYDLMMVENFR